MPAVSVTPSASLQVVSAADPSASAEVIVAAAPSASEAVVSPIAPSPVIVSPVQSAQVQSSLVSLNPLAVKNAKARERIHGIFNALELFAAGI
jgi:phosphoribosylcarboxyaminoimidazole (NCAIR) mutase